jgi:hypothetical protein
MNRAFAMAKLPLGKKGSRVKRELGASIQALAGL